MAFRFHRRESLRSGFRRIGLELIEQMERYLDPACGPVDVHGARKASKMIRSMLYLFQSSLTHGVRRTESVRFREFARLLSTARDAEVRLMTFRALTNSLRLQDSSELRELEGMLKDAAEKESVHRLPAETLVRAHEILGWARVRWGKLNLRRYEWNLLEEGLQNTYRSARRGYAAFVRDGNDVAGHEWRKAVKALDYQVRLLWSVRPAKLKSLDRRLDALGEVLGHLHDLVVLRDFLNKQPAAASKFAVVEERMIDQRLELKIMAERLALEALSRTPKDFVGELERWWRDWRG